MNYVSDTHSLVWYLLNDKKLSSRALGAFEHASEDGEVTVPAVVLAEVMYIADKGRITISFRETLSEIEACENFRIGSLDIEILRAAGNLSHELEMHDRLIVATAKVYNATLITCDTQITESGVVSTLW